MNELSLLPYPLRSQSISATEVVLPYPSVLKAIDILARHGIGFFGWEGWAKYPDGVGHYAEYQGIVVEPAADEDWATFVARSAEACRTSITDDWARWNAQRKDTRLLYFCVTGANEAWNRQHS